MDRLTKRGHKKLALLIGTSCSYGHMSYDCQLEEGNELLKSALDKLAMYEDLEEQDRLLKLPCKAEDTVYGISMGKIINLTVNEISIFYMKGEKIINVKCQSNDEFRNYVEREFGKTVFLTREEAEAAMNKLKGKYNKDIERD